MEGFSWVIDQALAGMARPGRMRPLEEDLAFLAASGIRLLVSLTETPPSAVLAARHGVELLHLPVADFSPPTRAQLSEFVDRARAEIERGSAVAVHCGAGMGRTGTFLAAYLISDGATPERAVARIRELRPGSIETNAQERALHDYYQWLAKRVDR